MSFDLSYSSRINKKYYVNLFTDTNLVYSLTQNSFVSYSLTNQLDYHILLQEDINRLGFYKYVFSDNFSLNDGKYIIEVFEMEGEAPNREIDKLEVSYSFLWQDNKEIGLPVDLSNVDQFIDQLQIFKQEIFNKIDILEKSIQNAAQRKVPSVQTPRINRN